MEETGPPLREDLWNLGGKRFCLSFRSELRLEDALVVVDVLGDSDAQDAVDEVLAVFADVDHRASHQAECACACTHFLRGLRFFLLLEGDTENLFVEVDRHFDSHIVRKPVRESAAFFVHVDFCVCDEALNIVSYGSLRVLNLSFHDFLL